jgi:hypothetical protein
MRKHKESPPSGGFFYAVYPPGNYHIPGQTHEISPLMNSEKHTANMRQVPEHHQSICVSENAVDGMTPHAPRRHRHAALTGGGAGAKFQFLKAYLTVSIGIVDIPPRIQVRGKTPISCVCPMN